MNESLNQLGEQISSLEPEVEEAVRKCTASFNLTGERRKSLFLSTLVGVPYSSIIGDRARLHKEIDEWLNY